MRAAMATGSGDEPVARALQEAPPALRLHDLTVAWRGHPAVHHLSGAFVAGRATAIVGPNDPLILPRTSEKTDWEVELAVVIGRKANYVSREEALSHVAGYVLHNDYSERAFQLERGGQWVKGKSCDTFAPLGPFLATQDEISDVHALPMWLTVNGEIRQQSNTSNLIFDVPAIVRYLSQFMSLLPGDVISTGTPAGVGLGFKPPVFLKAGDVVELGIDGLGSSRQQVMASV